MTSDPIQTSAMTPRALTTAALSGRIDRRDLTASQRLDCIARLRARIDEAEAQTIFEVRQRGGTWADVAELFGITRQAAWQRFGLQGED
jgi:hypothetical protein